MSHWFSYFIIYSFLGYCLEKLFAYATHSDRQVRKCFLLLPLCPVYGLAMTAAAALSPAYERNFFLLAIASGTICTLAEYLVHWFYERIFAVRFWDYSTLRGNINSRICPQFSLVWGILSAAAVRFIHPAVAVIANTISPTAIFVLWIALAVDCVLTAAVLLQYHDTELLSLSTLLSSDLPASPEHHDRRTDGSSR